MQSPGRKNFVLPKELARRYRVERWLGEGTMGVVLEVQDLQLDRRAAMKLMSRGGRGPVGSERFYREARSLARLEHPCILRILDSGIAEEQPYLVTELLQGQSLDLLPEDADPLPLMLEVAGALEAVHAAGMVHRDLKPTNLFLTTAGRVVVLDFGLALDLDATRLTQTNQVVGSLAFLSPEVLMGAAITAAADWYAWGATLYWLHERRPPATMDTISAMAAGQPRPELPFHHLHPRSRRASLVRACMATRPEGRPASREDLERLLASPDHRPTPDPDVPRPSKMPLDVRRSRKSAKPRRSTRKANRGVAPRSGRGFHLRATAAVLLASAGIAFTLLHRTPATSPPAVVPKSGFTAVDAALTKLLARPPGPLFSEDPLSWLDAPDRVDAIRLTHEWLAASPSFDSPAQLNRLAVLDRGLRERGAPPVFEPFLMTANGPSQWPIDPRMHRNFPELGPMTQGDLARTLAAAHKCVTLVTARDAELDLWNQQGLLPKDFPRELHSISFQGNTGFRHLLEVASATSAQRAAVARWTAPGATYMRAFLLASFQCLRTTDPKRRPVVGELLLRLLRSFRSLFLSGIAGFPPEVLTGGPSDSPEAKLLEARVRQDLSVALRAAQREWRAVESARVPLLQAALDAGGEGRRVSKRRGTALAALVEVKLTLGDPSGAIATVDRHLSLLSPRGQMEPFQRVVLALERTWRSDPSAPLVGRQVQALLARYDAWSEIYAQKHYKHFRESVGKLRRDFTSPETPTSTREGSGR